MMWRHTMRVTACILIAFNLYGLICSLIFSPISVPISVICILTIALILVIQIKKKKILVDSHIRTSFILFGIVIMFMLYFLIVAVTLLVYLNSIEHKQSSVNRSLDVLLWGASANISMSVLSATNLLYYWGNFLCFIFYIRAYYTMFWKDNIIYIFRYLKGHVNYLNHTLLSNLPKIKITNELKQTICSLCLQNYKDQENVTRLKCRHQFHLDCIKIWVVRSNCCPLCRQKVVNY